MLGVLHLWKTENETAANGSVFTEENESISWVLLFGLFVFLSEKHSWVIIFFINKIRDNFTFAIILKN